MEFKGTANSHLDRALSCRAVDPHAFVDRGRDGQGAHIVGAPLPGHTRNDMESLAAVRRVGHLVLCANLTRAHGLCPISVWKALRIKPVRLQINL